MSKSEIPVQKSHPSGSWRAVRSLAVPAGVTSLHSNEATTHNSGARKLQKVEEQSVHLKTRKSPGYFETADSSFSKS